MSNNLFSQRFTELKNEKGWTKEKCAVECGIGYGTVCNYEAGYSEPSVESLLRIAGVFDVSVAYLTGESDVKCPDVTVQAICKYTGLSERAVNVLHLDKDVHKYCNSFLTLMTEIFKGE